MTEPKRRSLGLATFLLVAGVFITTGALVVTTCLRLVNCPIAKRVRNMMIDVAHVPQAQLTRQWELFWSLHRTCDFCGGTGKGSLLRGWMHRTSASIAEDKQTAEETFEKIEKQVGFEDRR